MITSNAQMRYPYPRRRPIRWLMQRLSRMAFGAITELEVIGRENLPKHGPLIVVSNHFSFLDPALMVGIAPWPLEFLGGFRMPNAPPVVTWIPKMWGYFPVFRGTGAGSLGALRAAEGVLSQGGVLGIYPEAGNWATVLRPARPGTAFLAARTGAPLLPIGCHGLLRVFPRLREGRRQHVTVRIGKPFGPFKVSGRIADLIPQEKRGHYSDDPVIREAAKGTEIYPWDEHPEA